MTTYILHGGKTSVLNSQNYSFFAEFTKQVNKNKVVVLLCYFSREKHKWADLIKRDTESIKKDTNKVIEILVAENPKDLLQKLEIADVLYIAGGEAELIEPLYKELESIKQKLQGKVYAGSSMGFFMACEQYVLSADALDDKTVHKGLGLVPLQGLCHWDKEPNKSQKINLLVKSSKSTILVLDEFEYSIFYN